MRAPAERRTGESTGMTDARNEKFANERAGRTATRVRRGRRRAEAEVQRNFLRNLIYYPDSGRDESEQSRTNSVSLITGKRTIRFSGAFVLSKNEKLHYGSANRYAGASFPAGSFPALSSSLGRCIRALATGSGRERKLDCAEWLGSVQSRKTTKGWRHLRTEELLVAMLYLSPFALPTAPEFYDYIRSRSEDSGDPRLFRHCLLAEHLRTATC